MAYAFYYDALNKYDSATIYFKRALDEGVDGANKYDAAKRLFLIYDELNDESNAVRYAKVYMELSDSIDFGKRQELSATVNNQYQYITLTIRRSRS